MRVQVLLVGTVAACAGTIGSAPSPESYVGHMEAAAARQATYRCGDTTLNDQLTSGTERVTAWVPCWDQDDEAAISQRAIATRDPSIARDERDETVALAGTELASCRGIPKGELAHSPFAHRKAIQQVIPHRSGGQIHGVRIVMKAVPGLTAEYMRRAIGCHQARFARLGNPPTYLSDDPTLVEGAEVQVSDHHGHLEIFVRSDSDVAGTVAYARAQDLVRTRTAGRW
ncbi:MAG: hypothetical protein ABI867_20155 [Kofleriaceae bacterium]